MAKSRDTFYNYSYDSKSTEINIRREMINTMDGMYPEISKAQQGLLRKMRRDSTYNLIQCNCVDKITQEPDKDRFCEICHGEGYLWDEVPMQLYKVLSGLSTTNALRDRLTPPGLINIPLVVFYIRYDSDITKHDRIVELVLDECGDPVTPFLREAIHVPASLWGYRSDHGKLEYWKAYTHETSRRYLNAPKFEDI